MNKQVHIILRGRVQGVGFRFFIHDRARQLGLTGWVRNLADERVEAVATGEDERLRQFVALCKNGPPAAVRAPLHNRTERDGPRQPCTSPHTLR